MDFNGRAGNAGVNSRKEIQQQLGIISSLCSASHLLIFFHGNIIVSKLLATCPILLLSWSCINVRWCLWEFSLDTAAGSGTCSRPWMSVFRSLCGLCCVLAMWLWRNLVTFLWYIYLSVNLYYLYWFYSYSSLQYRYQDYRMLLETFEIFW